MYTGRTIRGGMDTEEKKEGKRSGFSSVTLDEFLSTV